MPILITDFDGTLTGRDFFELIIEKYDPPEARSIWRRFVSGEATLFDAIGGVFASLRCDVTGAEALVRDLEPAPGLTEAAARLRRAGWDLEIASAGCGWYIEHFLAWQEIEATVHACPGDFTPQTGLVMRPATDSPFPHAASGIDKPAVVRAALARDAVVAVAGDSATDREGMLLVPPERRFARRTLARDLAAEGLEFQRFDAWPAIADALLGAADQRPAG